MRTNQIRIRVSGKPINFTETHTGPPAAAHLPTPLADAAGITPGTVVVLPGGQASELLAGLTVAGTAGRLDGYQPIMDVLTALGLTVADYRHKWTPVHVLDFALQRAGITCVGERSALALATHLGVPALLGRTAGELPDAVTA